MTETREVPTRIGPYLIERRLGAGGMGVVYLAASPTGRVVALKVVRDQYLEDAGFRERFGREVTAVRAVSGAFTASVVDADPDGDPPWLATQFIDAPTLAQLVAERGPLPVDEVRALGYGLAEALRDIHRAGVVHRDLKPANVMMAADGPRVIDFGISRPYDSGHALTTTGKLLGTPPFMSPEQLVRPAEVGPASDVFALGALLVYAACGRGPFDADTPYAVAYRVVQGDPDLTGLPEQLTGLVSLCLAKEPEDRPAPQRVMALLTADPDELPTLAVRRPRLPESESQPGSASLLASSPEPEPESASEPEPESAFEPEPESAFEPGPVPVEAVRPRRRRRALWAAVAAVALVAISATTMALRPGSAKPSHPAATQAASPAGPFVEATAAARPVGWQTWSNRLRGNGLVTGQGGTLDCAAFGTGVDCLDFTGDTLYRLDRATGRIAWRHAYPQRAQAWGVEQPAGLFLVVNEESGPDGNRMVLNATDALTGATRWRHVFAKSYDGQQAIGPGSPSVLLFAGMSPGWYAMDPRNGKVLYQDAPTTAGSSRVGTPVAAGDRLALTVQDDGQRGRGLLAVDVVGERERWRLPMSGGDQAVLLPQSGTGPVGVLIGPETYTMSGIAGGAEARELVTVDLTTGHRTVTRFAHPLSGNAVVAGRFVVSQRADGYVAAADAVTGREVWHGNFPAAIGSGPVYADGRVYLPVSGGRVVCVDALTGAEQWISAQRTDPSVPLATASLAILPSTSDVVAAGDLTVFDLVPPH